MTSDRILSSLATVDTSIVLYNMFTIVNMHLDKNIFYLVELNVLKLNFISIVYEGTIFKKKRK